MWTKLQIKTAAIAARQAGLDDAARYLVLRQIPNAKYDRTGKASHDPSSTSKRLTNLDFEQYMAIVEAHAGGRLKDFPTGYWRGKAGDELARMRHFALAIGAAFSRNGVQGWHEPLKAFETWIKRSVNPEKDAVEQLNYDELDKLINGLKAVATRRKIKI
jgi:hypothetical protein